MNALDIIELQKSISVFVPDVYANIEGVVQSVKQEPLKKGEKVGAQLQFDFYAEDGSKKSQLVKVIGSKKYDLESFKGKYVVIKRCNYMKIEWNDFYTVADISMIEVDEKRLNEIMTIVSKKDTTEKKGA